MKQLLFGNESDQQSDIVLAQLSQEMYNTGLILALLRNLHRIGECYCLLFSVNVRMYYLMFSIFQRDKELENLSWKLFPQSNINLLKGVDLL